MALKRIGNRRVDYRRPPWNSGLNAIRDNAGCSGADGKRDHIQQRRTSDFAEELPELPPARTDRAHVVSNLAKPIPVPKGTRLLVNAHFDNSANNKFNPDPNQTVYYGDMTWEEMMFPFFSVVVDKNVDPKKVIQIVRGRRPNGA